MINLPGRAPQLKSAVSARLITVGVVLFLLLLGSIVYGFHRRIEQKEVRTEQQQTHTVAADAAQSNRTLVESPTSGSLSGLPVVPQTAPTPAVPPASGAPQSVPGLSGPGAVAPTQTYPQAAGMQPVYLYQAPALPPAYSPPQPGAEEQLRAQVAGRRLDREQQAIDAPTGIQDQHASAPSPSTPAPAVLPDAAALSRLIEPPAAAPSPIPVNAFLDPQSGYIGQNAQPEKRAFQQGGEVTGDDYLKTTRTPPVSRWVVQRGTVIPAALPSKIVSDLPGDLIAEVVRDVYDSPTQQYVEIPAGSRLVGEYNSSVSYGQNRVQVVWTAIYFPDGSFVDLDRMPAHAADGATGLEDQVDNHWKRTIAGVALSSLLAAGLQVSQNRTNGSVLTYPSTSQEIAAAVGTQASQLGQQITNRNLNVQPTLKIRPGEVFAVSVKKDIVFPGPYQPMEVK